MVAALQVAICIGQLGRGGSEKQLIGFLNGIDRQLIEPQIWVFNSGGAWEEPLRELGVKVIDFSAWPKLYGDSRSGKGLMFGGHGATTPIFTRILCLCQFLA